MTQPTIPEQKLARSRRILKSLREMQQRPNLSAKAKKQLPDMIEKQDRVVLMRQKATN